MDNILVANIILVVPVKLDPSFPRPHAHQILRPFYFQPTSLEYRLGHLLPRIWWQKVLTMGHVNIVHKSYIDEKMVWKNFFTSFTNSSIDLSSSRLWRDAIENTRIKACPFDIDSLCIAGNWCDPVVSVICNVHISFLFDDIT